MRLNSGFISKKSVFSLVLVAALAVSTYHFIQVSNHERVSAPVKGTLQVVRGDSLLGIASKLEALGVVKSKLYYYLAHVLFGRSNDVAVGVYQVSSAMETKDLVYTLEEKPFAKQVVIAPHLSKAEIGEVVGEALGWGEIDRQFFAQTYAGMQWQRYMDVMQDVFSKKYGWNATKTETFLELSALYYDSDNDFFKNAYEPGTYQIAANASRAQVAGQLIDTFAKKHEGESREGIVAALDGEAMNHVAGMINEKVELLPDLVAMPARDVTLKSANDKTLLLFTTSYWNKGRGPLELVGDPKTKGQRNDLVRNVYQRIYKIDGDYREKLAGSFLWHQPHLHYHFQDFATYLLEPVSFDNGTTTLTAYWSDYQKSTFCVRDSEPIDLAHPGAKKGATYDICGKERQGISPGWADSYYYTYVDQNFNVTKAPPGIYKLSIIINPRDRFEEITKDNNRSEVLIHLDVKRGEAKVLQETAYEKK